MSKLVFSKQTISAHILVNNFQVKFWFISARISRGYGEESKIALATVEVLPCDYESSIDIISVRFEWFEAVEGSPVGGMDLLLVLQVRIIFR